MEAVPLTFTISKQISNFILNYLICCYGIPKVIMTDNAKPFKNKDVKELCQKFTIQHRFSTSYYLQGNGEAKASNKTLIKILTKIVD